MRTSKCRQTQRKQIPVSTKPLSLLLCALFTIPPLVSFGGTLLFEDYNDQDIFNEFSGDWGAFASGSWATIDVTFATNTFVGSNGASLRIDYNVPTDYVGVWNSLIGKVGYTNVSLDFTDIYGALKNSAGNPSQVENICATNFSFWARGSGQGSFTHFVKIEFKNTADSIVTNPVVAIPDASGWTKYSLPLSSLPPDSLKSMKQLVFVIEGWRNGYRSSHLYLDDLAFETDEPAYAPAAWTDDQFLDLVSHRAFGYFLRFTNSRGFVHDRSTFSDLVSIGGIGFQLAAYCVGHQRGWADGLETRVQMILTNLAALPMGPEPGTTRAGYRGFYYHFLDADTGTRKDTNTELSVYDTVLLDYGVRAARACFPSNAQIQAAAQQISDRIEWPWMIDASPGVNSNRFYLGWMPEPAPGGTSLGHIDGYTDEGLMTAILALGSTNHSISLEPYYGESRTNGAYPSGSLDVVVPSWTGSAFTYFFAACWLNLRSEGYDLHREVPIHVWNNNRRALLANRQFCIDHADDTAADGDDHYTTYGSNAWGLTACDNLAPPASGLLSEYYAFGALPTEQNIRYGNPAPHLGTLAVYGAGSAVNYMPQESIAALRHFYAVPSLWHPLFGFGDAYSLDPHYFEADGRGRPIFDANNNLILHAATHLNGPWINNMQMAIDNGPMLLAVENYRSGLIWSLLSSNRPVRSGIEAVFGLPVTITNITALPGTVTLSWEAVTNATGHTVFGTEDLLNDWHRLADSAPATRWIDTSPPPGKRFYFLKAKTR